MSLLMKRRQMSVARGMVAGLLLVLSAGRLVGAGAHAVMTVPAQVGSGAQDVVTALAPVATGQDRQASGPMGSLTGRLVCSDTQRAARFANVMLIPVESLSSDANDRPARQRYNARTDLEGVFTVVNLPVGDYYVSGTATGYVSLGEAVRGTGQAALEAARQMPVVHVNAGAAATVAVSMDRGAVIAGKLTWDDGTPAAGVSVTAVNTATLANTAAGRARGFGGEAFAGFGGSGGGFGQTDDRGAFRLIGLAPGEYLVRASVQAPIPAPVPAAGAGSFARMTSITMYAPGKVRVQDAKTVRVSAGEEHGDVQFMLDLRALHTVAGRVSSTSDSATVSGGSVTITDAQDTTLTRTAQIAADGSFTLSYVPAGTYTMSVPYASSGTTAAANAGNVRGGGRGRASSFQPFQQTLSVTDTDVSGVPVTLTPVGSK